MRFSHDDIAGFAIATLAPPAILLLFLASYETWDHRGTPLLSFVASNVAVAAGLAAVFSRFVRRWELPLALFTLLVGIVIAVNVMQRTGDDGTTMSTALKWLGVLDFLLLNAAIGYQVMTNGLLPVLDRRSARLAVEAEALAEATEQ